MEDTNDLKRKKRLKIILTVSLSILSVGAIGSAIAVPIAMTHTNQVTTTVTAKTDDVTTSSLINNVDFKQNSETGAYVGTVSLKDDSKEIKVDTIKIGDHVLSSDEYSYDPVTKTITISKDVISKYSGDIKIKVSEDQTTPSKSNPVVSAPTAKTLVYNGEAQELVNAGSTTGGTLQYKLGDGEYSTDIPSATNAGNYIVYYKVVGNSSYNDVSEASITVPIAKAKVAVPTANTGLIYDGTLKTGVTLPDGAKYTISGNTATNVDDYTATVTLKDKDNYEWDGKSSSEDQEINWSIGKKKAVVTTAPTAKSDLTYTGSEMNLINEDGVADGGILNYQVKNPDNSTSEWSTTIPTGTAVGTYTVSYKVVGDGNHSDSDVSSFNVEITMAKATVKTAPTFAESLTYNNGNELDLVTSAGEANGGTLYYIVSDTKPEINDTWSTATPKETNAGTYKVWYYVKGDTTHSNSEVLGGNEVTINTVTATVVTLKSGDETISSATLYINGDTKDTKQLTAVVEPTGGASQSVTWSSSNTGVATVDENGLVTAVAKGSATITAKANDGSTTPASASCAISVGEVTGSKLTLNGLVYTPIDETNNCSVIWDHSTTLVNVTIPSTVSINNISYSVTELGDNAFYSSSAYCTSLKSVTMPNTITKVGYRAFCCCIGLTSVTLSSDLTTIGEESFWNCHELKSIIITSKVTSIGQNAFNVPRGSDSTPLTTELTTVTIDSSTIANLDSSSSCLLYFANTVYVKNTITNVGSYITNSFTKQGTSSKNGYVQYNKNA